ncbi:MAG: hypothetical protein QOG53_3163 [Frankiales bacterium]|jgi:hypothetical protein|nr:hypothetical protein [Frankiales bacterium]
MPVDVLEFAEAMRRSEEYGRLRHLLLGNGFSIAYDADAFAYGRLLDEADFSELSIDARAVFKEFGTTDFEKIIEILRGAATLLHLYPDSDRDLAARILADADRLKDALAEVLARRHPDFVGSLTSEEYTAARHFLASFERIYSVNYDLLLYWTTMQDIQPTVSNNDGFGESEDEPGAEWVTWKPMATYDSQRIFYLHGALHLFDAGVELRKLTWNRTGISLVDQIRGALEENVYPLVVTEGTSRDKYSKILHSAYLNHAMRSFSKIGGSLFIYGHSLAQNDEHILRRIEEGHIRAVFVSLYRDPDNDANLAIVERARALSAARLARNPLSVHFFDSESAQIWRT